MHSLEDLCVPVQHIQSQNLRLPMWMRWVSIHVTIIMARVLLGNTRGCLGVVRINCSQECSLVLFHTFLVWFPCIPTCLCWLGSLIFNVLCYLVEWVWYVSAYILIVPWDFRGNNLRCPILHIRRLRWKWLNYMYFECDYIRQICWRFSSILNVISVYSEADSNWVLFMWTHVDYDSQLCDYVSYWYVVMCNKTNSVCSFLEIS